MPKAFWLKDKGKIGASTAKFVGSGPYQVASFVPDSHVELVRSEHWTGTAPKVARIRFNFVADDNTRLLAWQDKQAEMSLNVPLSQAARWAGSAQSRVVYEPDRSYVGLTFNLTAKPFDDPHVRRAVAYAIDRTSLVNDILKGKAQIATALSTPEQFAGVWSSSEAVSRLSAGPQYAFDLTKAKAELAQSSVPTGFTASLSYPNTGPQLGTAALAFAASLKQIGITLNVQELAIEQWLAALGKAPALSYMWYFNTTGDPGELPNWFLQTGNPANYKNATVQATMVKAAAESDPATRAALLLQAQAAEAADLAYLPLWWGQAATAFTDSIGVKNFSSYTLLTEWPGSLYAAK
jgi:peptide/nickel transport system substrate-binding protein